jgi:tRNA threonylcarbamoyl adenosine modification protein YeaZ
MSKTYGLAIHTSSPELGFALSNFAGDSRAQAWNLGRDVSNQLHDRLREFLPPQTWQDLAFIAVAKGPGGFTGTRLGIVMARTLAQQLDIPLFAISSLAAIAQDAFTQNPTPTIAIQMPAQRGEVHAAIYQPTTTPLADIVLPLADWQSKLAQWQPVPCIEVPPEQGHYATGLLTIAHQQWTQGERSAWETALPYYGQHPV